jgi:hypothetical protein
VAGSRLMCGRGIARLAASAARRKSGTPGHHPKGQRALIRARARSGHRVLSRAQSNAQRGSAHHQVRHETLSRWQSRECWTADMVINRGNDRRKLCHPLSGMASQDGAGPPVGPNTRVGMRAAPSQSRCDNITYGKSGAIVQEDQGFGDCRLVRILQIGCPVARPISVTSL